MSINERIRQWLLCRCCVYRIQPRSVLYNEESRRAQWNDYKTDMSEWSETKIADVLISLVRNGEVRFWQEPATRPRKLIDISVEEIVDVYRRDNFFKVKGKTLWFGFTELGAKHWEAYFRPDWNKFHTSRLTESKVLLVAGSQEQSFQMLGAFPDFMGWDKRFGLREIRTGKNRIGRPRTGKSWKLGFLLGRLLGKMIRRVAM